MPARNSFSFFVSYIEAIEELPEKEQLAVLKAIIKYALYDEEPKGFKGIKQAVFLLVKPTLDKSKQKSANGKQGGSKRKANNKQNESKPEANAKHASILPSIGIGEGEGIGIGIGVGEGEGDNSAHADGALFTSFWNSYPEHARGDREAAWEAWKNLNPTEERAAQIMEYLGYWKESQRWTSDEGAFIPAAKNFLTPEKSYLRTKPAPAKKNECSWTPGKREPDEWEIEAIRRMMAAPEPELPDEVIV
jgi:hypothetical protein